MREFLISKGFVYDKDHDEWTKTLFDNTIIIWEKIDRTDYWQLYFVDKDEYLYGVICEGSESHVICGLISLERDMKIDKLI